MAMDKQEYFAFGWDLARTGNNRPEGNSWQAKAQQQGYDARIEESRVVDQSVPVGGYPVGALAVQTAQTPGIGRGFVEVRECYPVAHNPKPQGFRVVSERVANLNNRAIHGAIQRKLSTVNAVQSHINSLLHSAKTAETMKGAKLQSKAFSLALKWRAKGITLAY